MAYSVRRDKKGYPQVASGVLLDPGVLAEVLRWPFEHAELLPSALTGEASNWSVLDLAVQDPTERVIYRAGNACTDAFAGADTLGAALGDLAATVQLNPEIAQRQATDGTGRFRLGNDLGDLLTAPSTNHLTLKLSYWLGR